MSAGTVLHILNNTSLTVNWICIQRHMTEDVSHKYEVGPLQTLVESSDTNCFSKNLELRRV